MSMRRQAGNLIGEEGIESLTTYHSLPGINSICACSSSIIVKRTFFSLFSSSGLKGKLYGKELWRGFPVLLNSSAALLAGPATGHYCTFPEASESLLCSSSIRPFFHLLPYPSPFSHPGLVRNSLFVALFSPWGWCSLSLPCIKLQWPWCWVHFCPFAIFEFDGKCANTRNCLCSTGELVLHFSYILSLKSRLCEIQYWPPATVVLASGMVNPEHFPPSKQCVPLSRKEM